MLTEHGRTGPGRVAPGRTGGFSPDGHGRGGGADRGSVLLLFPAAVFVMLVLAAITLDVGLTHVRAQQLRFAAASAANDAVGALDLDALRSTGAVSFQRGEAERLARAAIAAGPVPGAELEMLTFARQSPDRWEIAVTLSLDVGYVIAPALPGAARHIRIVVTEQSLALVGAGR